MHEISFVDIYKLCLQPNILMFFFFEWINFSRESEKEGKAANKCPGYMGTSLIIYTV